MEALQLSFLQQRSKRQFVIVPAPVRRSRVGRNRDGLILGVGINDGDEPTTYRDPLTGKMKTTPAYATWHAMLTRCHSPTFRAGSCAYVGVVVCTEWLTFSNFKTWYDANYVSGYQLDKDLVNPGSKEYSPANCRYVPQYINLLITGSNVTRGHYPLGVSYHVLARKFAADCRMGGKQHRLGYFSDVMVAHKAWQLFKADAVDATVKRYLMTEKVVHVDVLKSLVAYADRLRSDAAADRETIGF